ncbi:PA0069 family radical SAM protein [Catalinimonas niigatensis]|uniref:PA0069 family radical SAM protein n=1 Tax=Catalinimonas niigatensis TaxID=1397264 RepID=UPI00266629E1|nr:PA0069 family radical SAM protein [Catalinimonas niigatensis]WPP51441.1 PA0069 family radical SAM protein [Catalinimonas niigatensis]
MEEDYLKGRGAQYNAHNKFEQHQYVQEHIEGLDEPHLRHPQRQLFYDHPKKIVNETDSPDLRSMFSINPYQGCEHGCIYCYARNSHEYWGFSAGLDFETKIVVKPNAPQLLEQHFQKRSWQVHPIALSGNTDCYQPVERELKITRKLLQVFLRCGNPVGIITKNSLIERDMDILKDLSAEGLVHVYISITSLNEKLRVKMEPRTASAARRLATLEKLASAGIPCGVMIAPVIPAMNDHEIPQIMEQIAEAGALTAGYTVVRLNGAIGPIFIDWLHKNFPDRAAKVEKQIKELHGGNLNDSQFGRRMQGEGVISKNIKQLFQVAKAKHLGDRQMPSYNLSTFRPTGTLRLF